MADTPDIDLSQHIHSLPFCSLCCGRWTHDIYSKLYLSEAPDNLGKVSGSLRKKWEEGRRLWLGYLFHGSLPMMLIILVGSSSGLDLPKETPLELSLIFSFSLLVFWGVGYGETSYSLAFTLPLMVFLHLAHNCPFVNKVFSLYFNLSAICVLSDAEIL